MNSQELQSMLHNDLDPSVGQLRSLKDAYKSCIPIGLKGVYTYNELDKYETLAIEFRKVCDLLLNRLLRLIDCLEEQDDGRIMNRLQRAYKKDLIEHYGTFVNILNIQNDIETEYMPDKMNRIYELVIDYVPFLLVSIERIRDYSRQFLN